MPNQETRVWNKSAVENHPKMNYSRRDNSWVEKIPLIHDIMKLNSEFGVARDCTTLRLKECVEEKNCKHVKREIPLSTTKWRWNFWKSRDVIRHAFHVNFFLFSGSFCSFLRDKDHHKDFNWNGFLVLNLLRRKWMYWWNRSRLALWLNVFCVWSRNVDLWMELEARRLNNQRKECDWS